MISTEVPTRRTRGHLIVAPRRLGTKFAALFALCFFGVVGVAVAFWSGTDSKTPDLAVADSVNAGNQPNVTPVGSTAVVAWLPSALQSGAAVDGYIVKRYDATDTLQTINITCSGIISALTCTESNVPDGTWKYTVTPAIGLWRGTESPARTVTVGATKLVFTTSATSTSAGVSTSLITIGRQDAGDNATTVGARIVTLGSDAATGTFRNAADTAVITSVTIPDGASTASFRYRDTLAGTPFITASSAGLANTSQAVTVTAAGASQLSFTTQPATSDGGVATAGVALSPQPQVTVQDQYGNNVTGATNGITLSITGGTGAFGAQLGNCFNNPVTAVNGMATFAACSIDKRSTGYTLRAEALGLNPTVSSPFDVAAGPATRLVFGHQPTSATAGQSISPAVTVRIEDALGNLTTSTASVTIGFGTNAGNGNLSGTSSVNASGGVAMFSNLFIDKAASGYTLAATSGTLTGTGPSSGFTIFAAAPSTLKFAVQPTGADAGVSISPAMTVRVEDAFGNLTSSTANVTVALTTPGGATLSGTASATASGGVATFSTLSVNKTGTYTLTATSSGLSSDASTSFTITPAAASALKFAQQPTTAVAGASISPAVTVRIEDSFGNLTMSTVSVTVAIGTNPSVGMISGTPTVAAVGGIATFSNLSINKVGTGYTLTAASSGLSGDTSGAFNIAAATASRLVFVQPPTNAVAGVTISPAVTVRVEDAFGNLITTSGAMVDVALTTPNGATLAGTLSAGASGGNATFSNLSINKTGTYTLTATSSGLASDTSTSFTIRHAAIASLTFSAQPSGSTGGVAFTTQPVVTLRDTFGNLVTTPESVTLSVTGNPAVGFSCTNATVSSNSSGLVSFAGCKINTAGSYTLTATAGSVTVASNSITIAVGPVAVLTFSTQPSSSTNGGTTFAQQPAVTVKDAGGNAIASDPVVLSVTGNPAVGFSCTSTTVSSNASGVASFSGCKINTAGSYTLTATDGAVSVLSSSVAITTGPVASVTFSTQPSGGTGGLAFGTQPVVTVKDLGGNPVSGDPVVLSVTGNPSVGFSCTAMTVSSNASGVATFAGCKINTAGSYTLRATDGALSATSNSIAIATGPVFALTFSTQPSATTIAGVVFASQPAVTATDAGGNLVSGASVVLSVTGNPSVGFSCPTSTLTVSSNGSGLATFAGCKITKTGTYTLAATVGTVTAASSSQAITPAGAVAPTFSTQPSGTATAGTAFAAQPVVTVVDAFGNARSGDSVVMSVTGNPSVGLACPTSTLTVSTDATGKATFAGCVITKAGAYTLVGTANALSVTSSSVTVSVAPAAIATFSTQPSATTVAGINFAQQPSVTVVDAFGNPRSGDSVVLTVTGSPSVGFSCTSTTATANASGVASFAGCKITKSGSYTLTATDGAASVASDSVTITPAAASKMVLSNCLVNNVAAPCTSPFQVGGNGTFKATIDVVDAFDNVPTAAPFTINLTSNKLQFIVTTTVNVTGSGSPTNRSGQFTVTNNGTKKESADITATSTGLTNLVFVVER